MSMDVVGLLELNSVAVGYLVLDALVKQSPVTVLTARPVNPGKFFLAITGDPASAEEAMDAGMETAGDSLLDHVLIRNVEPGILEALEKRFLPDPWDAVGLMETFTISAAVEAADRSFKTSGIQVLEIVSGNELGGKALLKIGGPVGDVSAAVEAAAVLLRSRGQLCREVIIPGPHGDAKGFICGN